MPCVNQYGWKAFCKQISMFKLYPICHNPTKTLNFPRVSNTVIMRKSTWFLCIIWTSKSIRRSSRNKVEIMPNRRCTNCPGKADHRHNYLLVLGWFSYLLILNMIFSKIEDFWNFWALKGHFQFIVGLEG